MTDFLLQFQNFLLLFLNRIEHGPDDRIVVDLQVTVCVSRNGFRNDLLQRLRAEANILTVGLESQRIILLVLKDDRPLIFFRRSSENTDQDPPPVLLAVPLTERVSVGAVVPIPTSPVERMVMRIELFVPR